MVKKSRRLPYAFAAVLVALSGVSPAAAELLVAPHVWFEGLQGDGLVDGQIYIVDADPFGVDEYDGGGAVTVEAMGEKWAFLGSFASIDSEQDKEGFTVGTLAAGQTMIDGAVGYKLTRGGLYGIVGARSLDYDIDSRGPAGNPMGSSDWIDPFIGFWYRVDGDKWGSSVEGDWGVGGDSDQIFNITSTFYWHFSHRTSLMLGYRAIDIHYEDEAAGFRAHWVTRGLTAGLAFRFE